MVKEDKPKITPVYIRSTDHTWLPVLQLKTHDGKAVVSVPKYAKGEHDMLQCLKSSKQFPYQTNNQIIDLKDYPNSLLPLQNVDSNGILEDYKDMVDLPFMHEVCNALKHPFFRATIPMKDSHINVLSAYIINTGCNFVQFEVATHS